MPLFFSRDKMSKDAGEWAAVAMACMVFADGSAGTEEIEIARRQAASNPVIKKSIGEERARELFDEAVQAIHEVPQAMLHSYEQKLTELAAEIGKVEEKNFALTTVIAVATADHKMTEPEHAMLVRFRESLGATIPLPDKDEEVPAIYRQAAGQRPGEDADAAPVSEEKVVLCRGCNKLTNYFENYGYWCAACELYSEAEGGGPSGDSASTTCPDCNNAAPLYEGYGYWCTPCQKYVGNAGA